MSCTLTITTEQDEATRLAMLEPLREFNRSKAGPSAHQPLAVTLRDERGAVVGGLSGTTAYGWLFVQFLVVSDVARGSGWGRRLMEAAEQEACRRGCHGAWLDTHEFQAPGFYEKLGYRRFGELPGYPPPFSRIFYQKALGQASADAV